MQTNIRRIGPSGFASGAVVVVAAAAVGNSDVVVAPFLSQKAST